MASKLKKMMSITKRKLRNMCGMRLASEKQPSYGMTTIHREQVLWTGLNYLNANKLNGSYAEFGVYKGFTFATAFLFANYISKASSVLKEMQFLAFDSFEGFPELKGKDKYPGFKEGGRTFGFEQFHSTMHRLHIPSNRMTAYKGWFSDILLPNTPAYKEIPDCSIAFAYVDCDLLESTRDVLPFLKKKIIPGAIVCFDNWYCFAGHPLKGEQGACREFLEKNTEIVLVPFQRFGWHGNSFIYHIIDAKERGKLNGIAW